MTTIKDLIRDEVMEYHKEENRAADPEVLVEAIINIIKDYFEGHFE